MRCTGERLIHCKIIPIIRLLKIIYDYTKPNEVPRFNRKFPCGICVAGAIYCAQTEIEVCVNDIVFFLCSKCSMISGFLPQTTNGC